MKKRDCLLFPLTFVLLLGIFPGLVAAEPLRCKDFELRDTFGRLHTLSEIKTPLKVVAFLGVECPLARLYAQRLNELALNYSDQVIFLGVNANCQDSHTEISAFARQNELRFPLLKDLRNRVSDQLKARRTPEVFLLDAANIVRYKGRIDDQYGVGYARSKPTRLFLRDAIDGLLAGNDVVLKATDPVGCHIGRLPVPRENGEVTFGEHIAPILRRHCVECHREDDIAPFALTNYEEVVGWGETIREVIEDQRMPPWHANPEHGAFINERVMSTAEVTTIVDWVESGMPRGDSDVVADLPRRAPGWHLAAEPDLVIPISDSGFDVPAAGTVEYQYFVVDPGFVEDRWVSAAEIVPGNRSVVHHAIVFVRPPDGERQRGIGWLTAYVPGQSLIALPEGMARRVPAGSKLVFQIHYTPTGISQKDATRVGIVFADPATITTEVQTRLVLSRDFEIPPYEADYAVHMSSDDFPTGSQLMGIVPHMHLRGKRFRVLAHVGGASKILLDVPNYDFNWQHAYMLKEYLPLAQVRIECVAGFDNSEANLVNPDPAATVRWGDQTWEEMSLAYLAVAVPLSNDETVTPLASRAFSGSRGGIDADKTMDERAREIADRFFHDLDANGDGEILRGETPTAFRAFAFKVFDKNDDERLTEDEVLHQARLSLRP